MQFITFAQNNQQHVGILTIDQQRIVPLAVAEQYLAGTATIPDSLLDIIFAGNELMAVIQQVTEKALLDQSILIAASDVTLLAPIPRPAKNIFCIGKNYQEHAFEFEKTRDESVLPKYPVVFSKPPTCVVGPNAKVKRHAEFVSQLDYEVELGVIIGKKGSKIQKEHAYDYIFGYTIINDVTARDLQKNHAQWLMGKGPDTFAPMGPCIVHKSAIPNPHDLHIQAAINGEVRQKSNTKDMIYDIPTIIATISSVITLEPGDIIATGTPAGVGAGFNPPKFLQSGDVMELEISGIGKLINTIE